MKYGSVLTAFAALALTATPAFAAGHAVQQTASATPEEASIPFANHGGIWDWQAQGDQTIYFQDNARNWYKASLFAPSVDLPFAQAIGVAPGPLGSLDRWSSVYIHGQRYPIQSLVRVSGPPQHGVRHSQQHS